MQKGVLVLLSTMTTQVPPLRHPIFCSSLDVHGVRCDSNTGVVEGGAVMESGVLEGTSAGVRPQPSVRGRP